MGVSFKVSKKGTRFRPKIVQIDKILEECSHDSNKECLNSPLVAASDYKELAPVKNPEDDAIETGEDAAGISGSSSCSGGHITSTESEVSFSLNLYHDGYFIGKPSEASAQDGPKSLHPYDRTSETLFSAIESGRLPGDILDDIPSKYFNGMLVCEVRDYRKFATEPGSGLSSIDQSPVVNRVSLRMSLENVVKDMPLISDDTWTYSDLMEVESRIVKAMQPQLCLDPTPMLDRLCGNPVGTKLNLGLCGSRKRRLRMMPEVTITSNNQIHGKKVCVDKVQELSNCRSGDSGNLSGDTTAQPIHDSMNAQHVLSNSSPLRSKGLNTENSTVPLSLSKHHQGIGYSRALQDHYPGSAINPAGISPSGRDLTVSYNDTMNFNISSVHGKRENQDAPLTPSSKRARQALGGSEGMQKQHPGPQLDSLPDVSWNNSGMHQHPDTRGSQYASLGGQKYTQKVIEGVPNQDVSGSLFNFEHQGTRYTIKDEQADPEKMDKTDRSRNNFHILEPDNSQLDLPQARLQQRVPQHLSTRSHFPQMQWHNLGQPVDNDPRKEDQLSKRKLAQSPRVSSAPVVQSPVSSKSGEFSSGSFGQHFNPVATPSTFGPSEKEKGGAISGSTVGGPPSVTSSPSDSMTRQHQGQMSVKRRSNSVPRTPAMSGVGSPASVSNMIVSMNASSPSISTPPLGDQYIKEKFLKIEMVAQRYQLHSKKKKVDNQLARKPVSHSPQLLMPHLSNAPNNEDVIDTTCKNPFSKSLISGSMNVCKTRAITFIHPEKKVQLPGNVVSIVPKTQNRLILSEKQNDGTVAMLYGDVEDVDLSSVEDYLPILPNTHRADLLAAQLFSLMARDGYQATEDHIRPKQTLAFISNGQSNLHGNPSNGLTADMQRSETASGPASSAVTSAFNSGNASLNTSNQNNTWAVAPGSQTLQISQGLMPGAARPITSQQMDPQHAIQQQHQQSQHALIQQHSQRGSLVPSASQVSHLNPIGQSSDGQLGNHTVSKSSHPQFQFIQQQQHQQQQQIQQQQQQQQQQPQMQRKMMIGLGTAMNVGNMGNNVVGLGGLGNVLGMGGARGIGGPGIAASMGSVSGISNMGQNPMTASNVSNLISQQIRSGNITHAQAATMAARIRMGQSRGGILGVGGPQSGISGMSGMGQMHPSSTGLSMLGQTLNRTNINPMQRTNIASMGPPKMIPGTNLYMNQQQQQLQMQHQQQQLQQQQQHIQQQQQQISSPLQAVVSPPQVGSPSAMAIPQQLQQQQQFSPQQLQPQQQFSPQQLNQQSPMSPRLSSGTLPPLNAANVVGTPASPQLSSQTLGSVGSITSSSMDLQGVNKSNSAGNM